MKESTEVLLDELLKDYQTPEQILGENGILKQLTKRLITWAMPNTTTKCFSPLLTAGVIDCRVENAG